MKLNKNADEECLILAGHGSRREKSNRQVRELASMLGRRIPSRVHVCPAFIELAEPSIREAVDDAVDTFDTVSVVPLSLFGASHVKNDVPLAVNQARERHPDTDFYYGKHLGVHPSMVEIVDDRVAGVERETNVDRKKDDVTVVLCARGSSDPDSNADAHKLGRLLYEGRNFDVETTFIGVTQPLLDDTLHRVSKTRPDAAIVVPYMLGDGVLTQRIHDTAEEFDEKYPYMRVESGEHIGVDSRLVDVLADRWEEARTGSVNMSCDTCKYKVEFEGYEDDLGGARANMRALAHQIEHADRENVDDEPHSHEGHDNHVVVCTNQTCAGQGSVEVLETLRRKTEDLGLNTKITRSSCLGRCGDGPMVAVYPDGVWYSGVGTDDCDEIVDKHLDDGEVVSRIVDKIL